MEDGWIMQYRGKLGNFPFWESYRNVDVYGWCRTSVILSENEILDIRLHLGESSTGLYYHCIENKALSEHLICVSQLIGIVSNLRGAALFLHSQCQ